MSRAVLVLVAGLAAASLAHAQATPVGLWKQVDDATGQERSLVRIVEHGGALSGTVEKIVDPNRAGMLCELCPGEQKGRPMLGLTILKDLKPNPDDRNVWAGGEILDPNNGKTYKARLTLEDGGKRLAVRGYIGTPLIGRTQTWQRAE